jgi:hypothetical protein
MSSAAAIAPPTPEVLGWWFAARKMFNEMVASLFDGEI